jgi:hypothetical protein
MLLTRAEEVVREQVREGGISETASRAVNRALSAAREQAMQRDADPKSGKDGRAVDI